MKTKKHKPAEFIVLQGWPDGDPPATPVTFTTKKAALKCAAELAFDTLTDNDCMPDGHERGDPKCSCDVCVALNAGTVAGYREVLGEYGMAQDLGHISVWRIRGEGRDAERIA